MRLAGIEVGTVERVGLSNFPQDPLRHTEVRIRIKSDFLEHVRSDSEAFITTEGLLGESVLEITRGVAGQSIPEGGVVPGARRGNIKQIVQNVDQITGNLRQIILKVNTGEGTFGKLVNDPALFDRALASVRDFESLARRAADGQGTLGKLFVSNELYDKMRGTTDTLDEVARDLRAGQGTLGKLIYDTTLHDRADKMMGRVEGLVDKVDRGEGTLGKLVQDPALYDRAHETFENASQITRKLNSGEGTFGKAVNDPALYDNVNEFTSEMRQLIGDFRKDPKKYLRIKLSLF